MIPLAGCKGRPTLAADAPWSPTRSADVPPGEEQGYDLSGFDAAARPCPRPPSVSIYRCAPVPKSAKTCQGEPGLFYPFGCSVETTRGDGFSGCGGLVCYCGAGLGNGAPVWSCPD
jgi:hypothetical protein